MKKICLTLSFWKDGNYALSFHKKHNVTSIQSSLKDISLSKLMVRPQARVGQMVPKIDDFQINSRTFSHDEEVAGSEPIQKLGRVSLLILL